MLKTVSLLLAPALLASCMARSKTENPSDVRVTNGKEEKGYPYVVRIVMDGGGSCTGSFVSDSLLVTAAHCVDKASSVNWRTSTASLGNARATRENIFIHPKWPTEKSDCNQVRDPKYDLALVRFPDGTYKGTEFARLSTRAPEANETFEIVGYGNNQILPYDKFCKLAGVKDGKCLVQAGTREPGTAKFNYQTVFEFPPQNPAEQVGCPVPCRTENMKAALEATQNTYDNFLVTACGGNFRDRSYQETGAGTKRSGRNVVTSVQDGTIRFSGGIGGNDDGVDSASGAGDSGGPLFIFEDEAPRIAAVTHGGSLGEREEEDSFAKNSIYVDLHAPHNLDWVRETVATQKLKFPGLL